MKSSKSPAQSYAADLSPIYNENRLAIGKAAKGSGSAGDLPPGSAGFESRTSTSLALCKVSRHAVPECAVHMRLADESWRRIIGVDDGHPNFL